MNILKSPILIVLLIFLILVIALMPVAFTQISIENQHCRLRGSDFSLQWKHSVEKTQWLEHYQREQAHFVLRYTDLVSFGAGTPSNYPVLFQKDGVLRMEVNQKISQLNWFISSNMQGRIISNGNVWKIYQAFPDFTLVQFSSRQAPMWRIWQIGVCQ